MSTANSQSLDDIVRHYFPSVNLAQSAAASGEKVDGIKLSQALYPDTSYTEGEKADIDQHLTDSTHLLTGEDHVKRTECIASLNTRLASRTTLLGSKPSVADIVLYARLAPAVKVWSAEERTGDRGYHHIVRYLDFVQNSPLLGLSLEANEKISIDPNHVLFTPKPLDPKQEKERRKKEKNIQAGTDDGNPVAVGRTKTPQGIASAPEKAKEFVKDTILGAKDAVTGGSGQANSKKDKKKEKATKAPKPPPQERPLSPAQIDLRVGHILKAVTHPNADSLYVSTIAVGDPPGTDNTSDYEGQVVRTVCSGLNGLVPLEEMQGRKIVAVCNLKPVTMRGIKSAAMVLAASPRLAEGEVDTHAGPVELVNPPPGAAAGDRVIFEGWDGEPEAVLNPKKKVWDMCQVGFTTTDDLGIAFDKGKVEQLKGEAGEGKPDFGGLVVKGGSACTVKSLKGAIVR